MNLKVNNSNRPTIRTKLSGISDPDKNIFYKKELCKIFDTNNNNLSNKFSIDTIVNCMLNNKNKDNQMIFTKDEYNSLSLIKKETSKKFNNLNTRIKDKQYLEELKKNVDFGL